MEGRKSMIHKLLHNVLAATPASDYVHLQAWEIPHCKCSLLRYPRHRSSGGESEKLRFLSRMWDDILESSVKSVWHSF